MWHRFRSPYLLLGPAVAVLGTLFLGGLGSAFAQSLGLMTALGRGRPTLEFYATVLASREFWSGFGFTVYIALMATVLSCTAGLLLAAWLAAAPERSTLAVRLPLVVPHTVAAYLTILWLSQSGLIARLAYHVGLIAEPGAFPPLVNDTGAVGILLTYVWKEAPFAALLLYPALQRAGRELQEVGATLGASRAARWRWIVLPLIGPALGTVALIIFSYTFGAYEVPFLLGKTFPRALPVAAMERFVSPDLGDRPIAMVYNLVISAMTAIAASIYLVKLAPRLDKGARS
jgi:putative spermidine/putrescine transport system permease protein